LTEKNKKNSPNFDNIVDKVTRKKSKLKNRKIFSETYRDVETALKLNLSLNDE